MIASCFPRVLKLGGDSQRDFMIHSMCPEQPHFAINLAAHSQLFQLHEEEQIRVFWQLQVIVNLHPLPAAKGYLFAQQDCLRLALLAISSSGPCP